MSGTDAVTADSTAPAGSGASYIWLMATAVFGVYMAFITPVAISLAVRVEQLAPGHPDYLGYVTGTAGVATLLTSPLIGTLSDRTRSRFGRRRPLMVMTMALGVVGLLVMAVAPDLVLLGIGWTVAHAGWGATMMLLYASQADRLPKSRRGRVSALTGVVQQLAPVSGVLLSGGFAGNNALLLLVPGAAGVVGVTLFVALVREPDSRGAVPTLPRLTPRSLVRSYVFSPRRSPDFAWNWLGKALFTFGLSFNTTFLAFFLASRLHMTVAQVSGAVAILGGGSIVTTMLGALGGGFLSDRLGRRRIFVLVGGVVFAVGATVMALAPGLPVIIVGALLGNLGLGLFSAVDQALMLDVLPHRETDAGRYIAIHNFANSIPQAIAPLIAPLFLAIGATGAERNYALLYLIAGALTVLGGLVVVLRVKSVR